MYVKSCVVVTRTTDEGAAWSEVELWRETAAERNSSKQIKKKTILASAFQVLEAYKFLVIAKPSQNLELFCLWDVSLNLSTKASKDFSLPLSTWF